MARILIIDENAPQVQELREVLCSTGHECISATYGEASADYVRQTTPDLVILSLFLTDTDAVELSAELSGAEDLRDLSVLVLSRAGQESLAIECLDAGAVDSLIYPVHDRLACARIDGLIRAKLDRDQHAEMTEALEQRKRALESTVKALRRSDQVVENARRQQRYLATHDALTGMANRSLFQDFARKTLDLAQRYQQTLAVLTTNLDHFKRINENLGNDVGDDLLRSVAQRLRSCVRGSDMVARFGSDEFAIILVNLSERDDAVMVAQKILESVSEPHQVGNQELRVTPSIGIAVYPDDGETPDELIRHADMALHLVKEQGRAHYQFYSRSMQGSSLERMQLEYALRGALNREEFTLYYQPQIDAQKGELIGAEALLRWVHPELGMIPPGRFIPIAESAGLIRPIGEWVMREACKQKRQWETSGLGEFPISVNVSFRQFQAESLAARVADILKETGLDPSHLDLEITENTIMDNVEIALRNINVFREMGVQISIDDFGTGYSSLSVLGKFPANTLKIDRTFVQDIPDSPKNAAITRAVMAVAKELGLKVIAEGVETEEEMAFLYALGCTNMQGYLFGRPVPASEFTDAWAAGFDFPFELPRS
ncbi:MAG: EAL domain-containing protein [bacterium]|nr:EAL domain-containing protein [bacterium]